jgi:hypothetical protein
MAACGSALLIVAGLFVKHSLPAVPLALAAWLLLDDRRRFGVFVATLALGGGVGILACRLAFGAGFVSGLLTPRLWSASRSLHQSVTAMKPLLPGLVAPALFVERRLRDRVARLLLLYAGFGLAVGVLGSAGAGVSYNAFFDALIAMALCAGHALSRLGAVAPRAAPRLRVLGVGLGLAAVAASGINLAPRRTGSWAQGVRAVASRAGVTVAMLRGLPDPVICEELSLCYWAGRGFTTDLFNRYEGFQTGRCDPADFIARIRAGRFSAIVLEDALTAAQLRLTGAVRDAIAARYQPEPSVVALFGAFLVPR